MNSSTAPGGPVGAAAIGDAELDRWLHEDVPHGDLTTEGIGIGAAPAHVVFAARSTMVVCGVEEAARLFERCGCRCGSGAERGREVAAGGELLQAWGPAGGVHRAWKTAQTLVEVASGIATGTAQIVAAVRGVGKQPAVVTTRKNFPGTRGISALAARAGGATAHRLGLSETLLVFPEHRAFLAREDVAARLQALRRGHPEKKLVVEVLDPDEAVCMAEAGAEVLQLEKFTPAQVAQTGARLRERGLTGLLAAAGGVNRHNAADYARAGADLLVTSAPYWAAPADVRVTIEPAS